MVLEAEKGIAAGPDVRVGSKADLKAEKSDFRFTRETGLKSDITACPKSANFGSR
jgi:hypothetical protein